MKRATTLITLGATAGAAVASLFLAGCGAASLFYLNEKTQAIQRDTITASGRTTFLQNPQDQANGVIKLAPVDLIALQQVTLEVPASEVKGPFGEPRSVMLPPGFSAAVVAAGLGRPLDIVVRPDGTIIYSEYSGSINAITPDGRREIIDEGLDFPFGLELHEGSLYYTDETSVMRFDFDSPTSLTGKKTVLTTLLPAAGINLTRTIRWLPSAKRFYISIPSTTNKNPEIDNRSATLHRMQATGGRPDVAIFGGLRNTVAMEINPESGVLWGIDNGTELLSEFLPPTEVNILDVGRGVHYGWPYYYSQNIRDPEYLDAGPHELPKNPVPPVIELESHMDVLDMVFYNATAISPRWKNAAILTSHSADNPRLVLLTAHADGTEARQSDFMRGFQDAEGSTWGTPVGVALAPDGKTLYITDDRAGAIYRVSRQ